MSLTAQETLSETDKIVLDSTCSFRHFGRTDRWPRFATLRMDVRKMVHPDIVADGRFLPFRKSVLDEIYCDPPHLIGKKTEDSLRKIRINRRSNGRKGFSMFERYYFWSSYEDWLDFCRRTNDEFARVLKPKGFLHYKISDGKGKGLTHLEDLKLYWRFLHIQTKEKSASVFKNRVFYLTFMPARIELENGRTAPF